MSEIINSPRAPKPVGLYPHAKRVGNLLFLSGVGPRKPGTNVIIITRDGVNLYKKQLLNICYFKKNSKNNKN